MPVINENVTMHVVGRDGPVIAVAPASRGRRGAAPRTWAYEMRGR